MTKKITDGYAMVIAIIMCRKEILHRVSDHIVMSDFFLGVMTVLGLYALKEITKLAITGRM